MKQEFPDTSFVARTKVWVVSLASAEERRAAFQATLPPEGLDWSFFDACAGAAAGLVYDEQRSQILNGRPLHPGELGCYSSHHQLWQWLVHAADHDQMIVIEDDVCMDWGFIHDIEKQSFDAMGIEYLRLFAKMPSPWRFVASPFLDKYRHLIQFTGYPLGTQAYLLTKGGAAKLIEHGGRIDAAVDVYMDRTWEHGVFNLAIFPFPAYERHQTSSIGDGRLNRVGGSMAHRLKGLFPKVRRRLQLLWLTHGWPAVGVRRLQRKLVSDGKP